MTGFTNSPVGAQGTLTRQQIKSANYVPASSGWILKKDGTVEFNTLGGTLQVTNLGVFFYVPKPGAGNLRFSVSTADGVDSYGNSYHAGSATNLEQVWSTGNTTHSVVLNPNGSLAGGPEILFISGGSIAEYHVVFDHTNQRLLVEPINGSQAPFWVNGNIAVAGSVNALTPVSHAVETWHPLPLINSWTNFGSAHVAGQYRLTPTNQVEVIGRISHAAISGTSVISSALGTGYTPANSLDLECNPFGNTAGPVMSPVLTLDTSGVLTLFNLPTGTTSVSFHNFYDLTA